MIIENSKIVLLITGHFHIIGPKTGKILRKKLIVIDKDNIFYYNDVVFKLECRFTPYAIGTDNNPLGETATL